jgi:hypothetical protein
MAGKRELVIEKFAKKEGWKIGVELGVWKGRTFKHLLNSLPDLHLTGIDLYAPQFENNGPEKWVKGENGHEWDHEMYYSDLVSFCKSKENRGTILRDYTYNAVKLFDDSSLDFVFIDADHSYDAVKKDIEDWDKKVKIGGYVIGHDIDWPSVKQAVEEKYKKEYSIEDDNIWYYIKR